MKHDKLISLIHTFNIVTDNDIELIIKAFTLVNVEKNALLLKESQVPKYLYFINSGYLRLYHYADGEEITTHINCPPGFITSFNNFIHATPSDSYLQCVTTCELLCIKQEDLISLYSKDKKWAEFGNAIYQKSLTYNEQRMKDMLTLSAEDRYQKLLSEYPDIIQNVPLQYIASFLGIRPESLSRIRRKIIS